MPNRLTRPGVLAYAVVGLLVGSNAVWMPTVDGVWSGDRAWAAVILEVIVVAAAGLFLVAAVARTPLFGDGPHLLTKYGWFVLLGLAVIALAVVWVSGVEDFGLWPTFPAALVPVGVSGLESAYFKGQEERRAARTK
ncbi:hypothetical protein [Kribbella sp. NPDC051770]|uniref:hypothetical protein n=1 Tax=Kribbella sp. NPDC051770 TaxID=3155413 RepID=UPI00342A2216